MFDRKHWQPGWDDRNMPPEDRAERDKWYRLYHAIERAIPKGKPGLTNPARLSDEQIFAVARKYGVDLAQLGFEV